MPLIDNNPRDECKYGKRPLKRARSVISVEVSSISRQEKSLLVFGSHFWENFPKAQVSKAPSKREVTQMRFSHFMSGIEVPAASQVTPKLQEQVVMKVHTAGFKEEIEVSGAVLGQA